MSLKKIFLKPLVAVFLALALTEPATATPAADTLAMGKPAAPLVPPGGEPGFRSLFVLVMPWNTDRHVIEARRKLQFALRLDEPKEPAFRVTLRF